MKANEQLLKAREIAAKLEQEKDRLDASAQKRLQALDAFLAR